MEQYVFEYQKYRNYKSLYINEQRVFPFMTLWPTKLIYCRILNCSKTKNEQTYHIIMSRKASLNYFEMQYYDIFLLSYYTVSIIIYYNILTMSSKFPVEKNKYYMLWIYCVKNICLLYTVLSSYHCGYTYLPAIHIYYFHVLFITKIEK